MPNLSTTYEVGENPGYGYPTVFRVISIDGVEVSREEPMFSEIKLASPETVALYFDALSAYFSELATYIDAQTDFVPNVYARMTRLRRLCSDITEKYDENVLIADPNYPFFDRPPVLQAEPEPVAEAPAETPQETPVTE